MGPIQATIECMKTPFRFRGRASRSEFWWFTLVYNIGCGIAAAWAMVPFIETIIAAQTNALAGGAPMDEAAMARHLQGANARIWIMAAALLLPMFAQISVTVRRLHDTDRSGWWWWIAAVPFVGFVILLILLVIPSDDRANRFGPPPGGTARKSAAPKVVKRGLPDDPENPMDAVSGAEALRALRQSRMPGNATG